MRHVIQNLSRCKVVSNRQQPVFLGLLVISAVAIVIWMAPLATPVWRSPRRAPRQMMRLISFDQQPPAPKGLGVSARQVLAAVNTAHREETSAQPLPDVAPFKQHGEIHCYKDRLEECYLVLTGDPRDVQLISVWVRTGDAASGLLEQRRRRYDLFDQLIYRTVAALDPARVQDVHRWTMKNIPVAMQHEAGAFASWGGWMTKVKFAVQQDHEYCTFLIGLPASGTAPATQQSVLGGSGVVHIH